MTLELDLMKGRCEQEDFGTKTPQQQCVGWWLATG